MIKRMFNDKPYTDVNREERFFCALFAHALLSSEAIRKDFSTLVASRLDVQINPSSLQVFLEAAALRDYWDDLGDSVAYSDETHAKRKAVLTTILKNLGLPESSLDEHDFFWTSGRYSKLWNPGRWNTYAIKQSGLPNLLEVKWAFNAKPDILIISDSSILMIEAKLESGEGRNNESGYRQFDIQKLIGDLLKLLVPQFQKSVFHNAVLALNPPQSDISWKELLSIVCHDELDSFTKACFSQLQRFYDQ